MFGFGLLDNGRGPAYPRILEEYALSPGQSSWFFSYAGLSGLLIGLSAPLWLPRFGAMKGLGLFNIVFALGNLLIASGLFLPENFLPSTQITLIMAGALVFGLGAGGTGICANMCVGASGPAHFHKRLYGGLHSLYAISSLIAPLVFSLHLTVGLDWRWYFAVFSFLPLLTGIYCLIQTRSSPYQWADNKSRSSSRNELFTSPWAWLVSIAFALYVSAEVILSSRLVYFVESSLGHPPSQAAFFLSLFFLGLLIGRLSMFLWSLPGGPIKWILFCLVASAGSILLGQFYSPYFFFLTGLFMSVIFPMGLTYLSSLFSRNFDNIMTMVMNSISLFIMMGHWLFGFLTDRNGIETAFAISPIFLLLSLSLFFLTDYFLSRAR